MTVRPGTGRFVGDPARAEFERCFFLDDADRTLVGERRGKHHMLGMAVQLGDGSVLGHIPARLLGVPTTVVEYVAARLDIADASA